MSVRDISDRKLDAKSCWLEAVVEHAPVMVLLFKRDGLQRFADLIARFTP